MRQAQGYYDEAQSLYRRALAARTHALGAAHPDTINTCKHLLALLRDRGRTEEALELEKAILQQEAQQDDQPV